MVAINFPDSPTVGQLFISGDRSWVWSGITWDSVAGEYGALQAVAPITFDQQSATIGINQSQLSLSISQIADYVEPVNWTSAAVSSNTTLIKDINYFVDTSASVITLTLPSTPEQGDEIHIFDATGNASVNNIVVTSVADNIAGLVQNLEIDVDYAGVVLIYVDTAYGWRVN